MEVHEVKALKDRLTTDIRKSIIEFEEKTGMGVEGISYGRELGQ